MKEFSAKDFKDTVIDVHSHIGVSVKAFANAQYPYAESLESLYFKQLAAKIDCNVIFPVGAELHADLELLIRDGVFKSAAQPVSEIPYQVEQDLIYGEMDTFYSGAENRKRFLPFLSFDPGRKIKEQLAHIRDICRNRPCYGIKINSTSCQTDVAELAKIPEFFEFIDEFDLPVLFHCTFDESEVYAWAEKIFNILDRYSFRCCMAHCIGFYKEYLDEANRRDNVWVDTAALKIQLELIRENYLEQCGRSNFIDIDYYCHKKAMIELMRLYPDTIIWGTDSPFYSYITKRKLQDGSFFNFDLKGSIFEEKEALDALNKETKVRACNTNSLNFIFG